MASFDELLGNLELALGIEPRTCALLEVDGRIGEEKAQPP
jgi:hypothetical protein